MRWTGERVVVVGCGRAGRAAAQALQTLGARVYVSERGPHCELPGVIHEVGGHGPLLHEADWVLPSPGISPYRYPLASLHAPFIGELDVVAPTWEGPSVAVTGTNGKTTTVALLAHVLEAPAWGNIGPPLGETLFSRGLRVLELSSFQLHATRFFRPSIAVLLNIGEDHRDWYPSHEHYVQDKLRIFRDQISSDWAIFPREWVERVPGRGTKLFLDDFPGIRQEGDRVSVKMKDVVWEGPLPRFSPFRVFDLAVRVALLVGILLGYPVPRVVERIQSFRPLPHRLELLGEIRGRVWINDSKATNPHAVQAALEEVNRPVVLLLGGLNKGLSFHPLRDLVAGKVRHLVVFGASGDEIAETLQETCPLTRVATLEEAVHTALKVSQPGDWILFSPGCASFDAFRNYAHRGEVFREILRALP